MRIARLGIASTRRLLSFAAMGLLFVGPVGAAEKVDLTGEWKIDLTLKDNDQTFHPTLKLKQQGDQITGTFTSSLDNKESKIEDASFKEGQLQFKVKREFEGQSLTATYKGKLDKDSIKGTAELEREGQTMSAEFVARRSKDEPKIAPAGGLTGKYKVEVTAADGQQFSTTFELKEEKEKLSGIYTSILDGSETPFKKVERKGNRLRMELQRERDGRKLEMIFDGELKDDKIKGKVKYDAGEQSGEGDFEAAKDK